MGLFDDALKNAVPGGDLATPIAVAAGALLLGKFLSSRSAPASPAPVAPAQGGGLLGGLSDLIERFQNNGQAATVNSWVGPGQNAPIAPGELATTLGQQTISDLARQSGMSEQDLLAQLAKVLPNVVNNLTPNGRLPTAAEAAQ